MLPFDKLEALKIRDAEEERVKETSRGAPKSPRTRMTKIHVYLGIAAHTKLTHKAL